jgi:anti-anti-sigma factor
MSSDRLEVTMQRVGDHTRVQLAGELDGSNVELLNDAVRNVNGPGVVEFDTAGVEFVDSAGLAAVLEFRDRIAAHHGHLILISVSPALRRILEITALIDAFEVGGSS